MLYELALETMVGVLPRFYWLELPEEPAESQPAAEPVHGQLDQQLEHNTPDLRYYYDGEAFRWLWKE